MAGKHCMAATFLCRQKTSKRFLQACESPGYVVTELLEEIANDTSCSVDDNFDSPVHQWQFEANFAKLSKTAVDFVLDDPLLTYMIRWILAHDTNWWRTRELLGDHAVPYDAEFEIHPQVRAHPLGPSGKKRQRIDHIGKTPSSKNDYVQVQHMFAVVKRQKAKVPVFDDDTTSSDSSSSSSDSDSSFGSE
jgi:hypothetical protein